MGIVNHWDREIAAKQDAELGDALEDLANHTYWLIVERCPQEEGVTTVTVRMRDGRLVSGRGTFVRDAVAKLRERIESDGK